MRQSRLSALLPFLTPSLALLISASSFAQNTCTFDFMISKGKGQPLESCTSDGTGKDKYAARLDAEGGCIDQIKHGRIITTTTRDCRKPDTARAITSDQSGG